MVELAEAAGRCGSTDVRDEVGKASGDTTTSFRDLIRVREVNPRSVRQLGGSQSDLPAADERLVDRERKEEIGLPDHIVIEKVSSAGAEGIGVELPAAERDYDSKLMLLVALSG